MECFDIHWLLMCFTFTLFLLLPLVGNCDKNWWFGQSLMVLVSNHVNKGLIWGINYLHCVNVHLYTLCILTHCSTLHSKAHFLVMSMCSCECFACMFKCLCIVFSYTYVTFDYGEMSYLYRKVFVLTKLGSKSSAQSSLCCAPR